MSRCSPPRRRSPAPRLDELTECGLSRRKAEYVIGASAAIVDGTLDLAALENAPSEEVRARIDSPSGVRPLVGRIHAHPRAGAGRRHPGRRSRRPHCGRQVARRREPAHRGCRRRPYLRRSPPIVVSPPSICWWPLACGELSRAKRDASPRRRREKRAGCGSRWPNIVGWVISAAALAYVLSRVQLSQLGKGPFRHHLVAGRGRYRAGDRPTRAGSGPLAVSASADLHPVYRAAAGDLHRHRVQQHPPAVRRGRGPRRDRRAPDGCQPHPGALDRGRRAGGGHSS